MYLDRICKTWQNKDIIIVGNDKSKIPEQVSYIILLHRLPVLPIFDNPNGK